MRQLAGVSVYAVVINSKGEKMPAAEYNPGGCVFFTIQVPYVYKHTYNILLNAYMDTEPATAHQRALHGCITERQTVRQLCGQFWPSDRRV